jgi:NAD(P)-dependent dehydrogenase (short-subunit alcohol dehydrogenase family)
MSTRVVVITGGGTGIGAAVAKQAADSGWQVVITGRRVDVLASVAEQTGALAIAADMADEGQVNDAIGQVIERFGRIDGVVANAGIMRVGDAVSTSVEDWNETLRVNLNGPFLLARAAMPHLLETRGAFVSVSSIASLRVTEGAAAYSVSKAALTMLTMTLARDFARQGVRANVVSPGWVRTEMADGEMAEFGEPLGLSVDQAYEEVTALVPAGRAAAPSEVAHAVLWLLGPESSYVNGATLVVDGGTILGDPGTVAFEMHLEPRQ